MSLATAKQKSRTDLNEKMNGKESDEQLINPKKK